MITLACLSANSNYDTLAFIWENAMMMDSLVIVAACDLELPAVGWYHE